MADRSGAGTDVVGLGSAMMRATAAEVSQMRQAIETMRSKQYGSGCLSVLGSKRAVPLETGPRRQMSQRKVGDKLCTRKTSSSVGVVFDYDERVGFRTQSLFLSI
jgi:hypothetical protein